jgi:cyclophilin family peptidyl-prolyl cis-trans isomerase/HEAT repeat protein
MNPNGKRAAIALLIVVLAAGGYILYTTFTKKTIPQKLAHIVHLEDTRVFNEQLEQYLKDNSEIVRSRAALAIGHIGGSNSAAVLFTALGDQSEDVAASAAFAIGLTGDSSFALKLLDTAATLPVEAAANAIISAGRLSDSTQLAFHDHVSTFLTAPDPELRAAACRSLFYSRGTGHAADVAAMLSQEADELVQREALYCLGRLKRPEGAASYVKYLADADGFYRLLCVRGLSGVESPEAQHYIAIALNDGDPIVRAQAINELGGKKTEEAYLAVAGRLANEDDENLQVLLLNSLQRIENENGITSASAILQVTSSVNVKSAALQCLAALQKEGALPVLDSFMLSPDQNIRAACATAYGLTKSDLAIKRETMLFTDKSPRVRNAAFSVLVDRDSVDRSFHIKRALVDTDYVVQVNVIDEIAGRNLDTFIPDLYAMSAEWRTRPADVRRSLVAATEPFLEEMPTDTSLMRILTNGTLDEEYVVRKEAAGVYKRALKVDKENIVPPAKTRITERELETYFADTTGINPMAVVITNKGEITMELLFNVAPLNVLNFIKLSQDGFYNNLTFHRVVPGFVVQGGDPRGDGSGGPDYMIRCEYSNQPYDRGSVGIATSGKDTGGSQFFFTIAPQPHLEGRYTLFAQVTEGMDVVDKIVIGDTIRTVTIDMPAK